MTSSSCAALSGLNARNARKQSSDKLTSSYVALAGLSANMPELSPVNETTYVLCPRVNDQGLRTIIIVSRTSVVAFAWQGGPEKIFHCIATFELLISREKVIGAQQETSTTHYMDEDDVVDGSCGTSHHLLC